jgi:hypothetical protein
VSQAGIFWADSNSSYNALQLDLNRRFVQGLQFRLNYTWSKNLDNGSAVSASQAQNQPNGALNPYDNSRDWGPSAMNVRHSANGNFTYELPFGAGQPWLNGVNGVAGALVSGWQVNSIVTFQSGLPFTPQVGSNESGNGNTQNTDRPSVNPAFAGPVIPGTPNRWFDPNAFLLPTPGTFGNLGRGTLEAPGLAQFDASELV